MRTEIKKGLIEELDRRVTDKILEPTNAKLLKKLINNAENDNEAMMIAELGTTYKKTGFHFDPRLEKTSDDIRYFKKNQKLSFHTDDNKPTHKLIIGDNYEALQNLLIQYKGNVDVIYIDPPYGKDNMGDFAKTNYQNAITRDNLLSMLYPRLQLAKQLLAPSGVIFCSIDDRNQAYVKCLFDEVFEENNMITCFPKKGTGGRQDSTHYAIVHEYLICYAREKEYFVAGEIESYKKYKFFDEQKGLHYNTQLLRKWGDSARRKDRPNCYYPIYYNEHTQTLSLEKKKGFIEIYPKLDKNEDGRWRWKKSTMREGIDDGIIEVQKKGNEYIPFERLYEDPNEETSKLYSSWIDDVDSSTGTKLVKKILPEDVFSYPKATDFILKILEMSGCKKDAVILDFFAGSGTTGHAILELNETDGGNRKFILCQLNENLNEALNSTSNKTIIENQIALCEKYKRPHELSEITAERLRRIMTGKCYDGTKDFPWLIDNKPYGGNLDVYEIAKVLDSEMSKGKTPFDVIDETLYGKEKFKSLKEKVQWVCEKFSNARKHL